MFGMFFLCEKDGECLFYDACLSVSSVFLKYGFWNDKLETDTETMIFRHLSAIFMLYHSAKFNLLLHIKTITFFKDTVADPIKEL